MRRWEFPLFLALVLGGSSMASTADRVENSSWHGVVRIGDVFHDVKLERFCGEDSCELTVAIYLHDRPVGGALVRVTESSGELLIDSRRYPIEGDLAKRWLRQLRDASICTTAELARTSEPPGCRSEDVVEFAEGLTGKIEERRDGRHEIRFFSLDEWPNPFGELVTLGLRRVDQGDEEGP